MCMRSTKFRWRTVVIITTVQVDVDVDLIVSRIRYQACLLSSWSFLEENKAGSSAPTKPTEKEKDWKAESLKYKTHRLTLEQRKVKIEAKIKAFKAGGDAQDEMDEDEDDVDETPNLGPEDGEEDWQDIYGDEGYAPFS